MNPDFMKMAIEKAWEGHAKGHEPFGSCVVKAGEVLSLSHNTIRSSDDPTAHAEMNAIREACRALDTVDLSGCAIYSTTEPCTMCFSAIHWARLSTIVYGAQIRDAKEFGFSELHIPNEKMRELAGSGMELVEDVLREECMELFRAWSAGSVKKVY